VFYRSDTPDRASADQLDRDRTGRPSRCRSHCNDRKMVCVLGIGMRLIMAAISQIFRPSFTASILGLHDEAAEKIVSELGYANLSMGLVAALSVVAASWTVPAALAGALFLGLAGLKHWISRTARSRKITPCSCV
jgi:hypothetical protein